jgi:hypothetical protein
MALINNIGSNVVVVAFYTHYTELCDETFRYFKYYVIIFYVLKCLRVLSTRIICVTLCIK